MQAKQAEASRDGQGIGSWVALAARRGLTLAVAVMLLAFGVGVASDRAARGDGFRIDSKVFSGKGAKPLSQSVAVFHDGTVYDYLETPAEVVIFDKAAGRFVLLDETRRIRTELSTVQVKQFAEQLSQSAGRQKDPFLRFLATPKFDETYDKPSGQLVLSSPWMTYRMSVTDAASQAVAAEYREFSDWYARLNAMLRPGSKPPSARLLVNAALFRRGVTAREVHLSFTPKKTIPPKRISLTSRHQWNPRLTRADLDRIAETRELMSVYDPVSFEQYQKRP